MAADIMRCTGETSQGTRCKRTAVMCYPYVCGQHAGRPSRYENADKKSEPTRQQILFAHAPINARVGLVQTGYPPTLKDSK